MIVLPRRLSDEVADRVRALIDEKNLEAGMKLPAERQLAMQLGVSRNSLREALAKLVSEGVLLSRRGGGTFIRWRHDTWSEQNIVQPLKTLMADDPDYSFDILEARYAIEASTAWHAAMRATPGDKEKIQLCFEATLSEDPDIASQADVRFHLAIAEASHNIVLLQTMRGFFDVLQSSVKHSRQRMYLVPPVFSQLTEQHQAERVIFIFRATNEFRNVLNGADLFQHLQRRFVRAAVRRSPQGGDARSDTGERVRA